MSNIVFKWKMESSMAFKNHYHALYSDRENGVTCEVITKRTDGGYGTGKAKSYFFINNDKREFKSEEDLAKALEEKRLKDAPMETPVDKENLPKLKIVK